MTTNHEGASRSAEEIAQLFEIAGRETEAMSEAIQQLSGCVDQLLEVHAAKQALMTLTPAEVRAALELRRLSVGGAP